MGPVQAKYKLYYDDDEREAENVPIYVERADHRHDLECDMYRLTYQLSKLREPHE